MRDEIRPWQNAEALTAMIKRHDEFIATLNTIRALPETRDCPACELL